MGEPTEREWLEGLRYDDKFPSPRDRIAEAREGVGRVISLMRLAVDMAAPEIVGVAQLIQGWSNDLEAALSALDTPRQDPARVQEHELDG